MIGRSPMNCRVMAGGDAVAGHVGQLLVHELRRIGAALADQAGVEPLLGDALELAEQIELGLLAGVAPLGVEQTLGEVEEQRGRPHVAQVLEVQVHAFADDAGVAGDRRADQIGGQLQDRVVVELGGEPLLRQFDAVALDAREADFQASRSGRIALTWTVSRGGCGGATTGLAVKSKGMPNTSAYSTLNRPSSFRS